MAPTRQYGSATKSGEKGVWKGIMDSLVSQGYRNGLINIDYISIDSSTIPAKKGGKQLASTVIRRSRGARHT
jgi:hypothetical protein